MRLCPQAQQLARTRWNTAQVFEPEIEARRHSL
jgi:hypothetical protein